MQAHLTESAQKLANTILWVLGLHGQLGPGSAWEVFRGRFQRDYLLSIAQTIAGGTSEIQRELLPAEVWDCPEDNQVKSWQRSNPSPDILAGNLEER